MENVQGKELPRVGIVVPIYGKIDSHVQLGLLAATADLTNTKCHINFVSNTNKMGLVGAENILVERALEANCDYLFMSEMDMILPTNAITKMLSNKVDACAGVYFLRGSGEPCLYAPIPREDVNDDIYGHVPIVVFPEKSVFQIGCGGMGCILFNMKIFKTIPKPWFETKGDKYTTDMVFSKKLRKYGFQLWADSNVMCEQIDESEPRRWGYEDYKVWLNKRDNSKGGFFHPTLTEVSP